MILQIKQWETIYLRDFNIVKEGEISEVELYRLLTTMYYEYVSKNEVEPFTLSYGRSNGFCINANSHLGIIINNELTLFIESMIPDLTLGKILYLNSQAQEYRINTDSKRIINDYLNDEECIEAIDYFIVSLLQVVEDIYSNGLLSTMNKQNFKSKRLIGKLNFKQQLKKDPSFDIFYLQTNTLNKNISPNKLIKTALSKAFELTRLEWIRPLIHQSLEYFIDIDCYEDISNLNFPILDDFTSIVRNDYMIALKLSKFIISGYDPLAGEKKLSFPEFLVDMNIVFENYVNIGLKRIFKVGYENKKKFTLGITPINIPIEKKFIELDGYYENNNNRVVIDTKNKYRSVLDREIPDFIAENTDIFQQYYYASRVNANNIILVYPSNRRRNEPIGTYQLHFDGNKNVNLYLWALQITGTPKVNENALINLAKFIDSL